MDDFINISQSLGNNLIFVQGAGGNTSIKLKNKLYVKSSGEKLKTMSTTAGYVCCRYKQIARYFIDKKKYNSKQEQEFLNFVNLQIIISESDGKPSMEAGFHAVIPSRCVIHLHHIYANIFTCMKNGKVLLKKIFKKDEFLWLDYVNPGYELAFKLFQKKQLPPIIFLKNHGIIIHGRNTTSCLKYIHYLHNILEDYLEQKKALSPFTLLTKYVKMRKYLFPDAGVFSNIDFQNLSANKRKDVLEIFSAQQYILKTIRKLKHQPVFLTKKEVQRLLAMSQEKYRQQLLKK